MRTDYDIPKIESPLEGSTVFPKQDDEPPPFTPEFAARQKELLRRRHTNVTRGEYEDLQAEVERLAKLLKRFGELAAGTQKRQAEMRADLLAAGAFEKKGKILLPRDLN